MSLYGTRSGFCWSGSNWRFGSSNRKCTIDMALKAIYHTCTIMTVGRLERGLVQPLPFEVYRPWGRCGARDTIEGSSSAGTALHEKTSSSARGYQILSGQVSCQGRRNVPIWITECLCIILATFCFSLLVRMPLKYPANLCTPYRATHRNILWTSLDTCNWHT